MKKYLSFLLVFTGVFSSTILTSNADCNGKAEPLKKCSGLAIEGRVVKEYVIKIRISDKVLEVLNGN